MFFSIFKKGILKLLKYALHLEILKIFYFLKFKVCYFCTDSSHFNSGICASLPKISSSCNIKKICVVTTSFSYLIMYISKGHNLKKWVNFNKNGFCYWVFLNSFWVFVFLMMRGNGSVRAIFSCQVYSVTEDLNRGLKKY